MIRAIAYTGLFIFIAILQSVLWHLFSFPALLPDILLILVVLQARFHGGVASLFAAAVGGLTWDSIELQKEGYYMLMYVLLSFLVISIREKMYSYSLISFFVLFSIIGVLKILFLVIGVLWGMESLYQQGWYVLLVEWISSVVFSIPLYMLYRFFQRKYNVHI